MGGIAVVADAALTLVLMRGGGAGANSADAGDPAESVEAAGSVGSAGPLDTVG
ncbi:hypothetical protein ACFZDG_31190 [Kitasatospora xanthocidica]|uniref:hypothetical protein n=1 Tax=Kitasatospora xanthocidica TaxID=83382 RepID=UPI0036EAD604